MEIWKASWSFRLTGTAECQDCFCEVRLHTIENFSDLLDREKLARFCCDAGSHSTEPAAE
jgi:hypothetical protein